MLAVISACDLGYIEYTEGYELLENIIFTIQSLQNGMDIYIIGTI